MDFHTVRVVDPLPLPTGAATETTLERVANHLDDPYHNTAFQEQRVSLPYTLADLISKYGRNAADLESRVTGAGTVTDIVTSSAFRLNVTNLAGDSAAVRSSSYYRYQSGRGLKITHTGVVEATPTASATVRFGFADDNDGVYWECDAVGMNVCIRSSASGFVVINKVPQANWDNPAPAFPTPYDKSLGNIYEIQLQWLGVGSVQFFINGVLVHTIAHANLLPVPYMRTADLPIMWEVSNNGVANVSSASFLAICGNVTVQSGQSPPEYGYAVERDAFRGGIGAAYLPLLAIRLAPTINGVDNRSVVYPTRVVVSCETSRTAYRVLVNPTTLTGAVFNAVGGTSCMEFDIAATGFTGGEFVAGDFLPNNADSRSFNLTNIFKVNARKLRRSSFAPGTSDVLLVVGRNEAGGAATMRAGLQWAEVR